MSVYRPKYRDPKTGELVESKQWWYSFFFAGKRIRESSKSTRKTIAADAEKKRRLELEKGFNGIEDKRSGRIRTIGELAGSHLKDYRVRHQSVKFAEYALGHVKRIAGKTMTADVSDATVKDYQTTRLKEKASTKSINEEVGFLLRLLEDQGDVIRLKMRRQKTLKLAIRTETARAFTAEEKAAMIEAAKKRRSPHIVPALMLALHAGLRDSEIRDIQWTRLSLEKAILIVGDSKTEAGKGRTIPLNADVLRALVDHGKWYLGKLGEMRPEWYVFPFGRPQPTDPTRPATTFKTVWSKVREATGVTGRRHNNRHTFITDLAEKGEVTDETIRQLAGHVSKQMLEHYSHIRMDAKRRAVETLTEPKPEPKKADVSVEPVEEMTQVELLN